MRLTDTIKSAKDLAEQYKDSANLCARVSIYRFGVGDGFGPAWVFDRLLEQIEESAEILELGAGPAGIWKANRDRIPPAWRIVLTDLMPGMIAEASGIMGGDARFRVHQMDAQKLDFPDASFDAVIANHMLYHVDDRPRCFSEIRRVLKPKGKLLASTNSDSHMVQLRQLLDEFLGEAMPVKGPMPFSLENGAAQLRPFFADVTVLRAQNELRITDAEAVVQYVLSVGRAKAIVQGQRLKDLRDRVQHQIDTAGAFIAQTDAGMFIASA